MNSQQQLPLDCCHWLHFEIDSIDLENILLQDFYPRLIYGQSELTSGVAPEIENWWHPEKLGDSILCFERESEKARESLYTNAQKTEVYFKHWWK